MGIRLKRMLAFLIDWNLICLPAVLVTVVLGRSMKNLRELPWWAVLGMFFCVLLVFGVMMLRDWLLRGRSLGKRIFNLYVYDQKTLEQSAPNQRILRNVFLFLYPIDGVLLLTTGRTIGDRVAGTVVLTQEEVQVYKEKQSSLKKQRKRSTNIVLICAGALALCIVFLGLLQVGLNRKKNEPIYQAAYQYLIESDGFQRLNKEESDIRFMHYYARELVETERGTFGSTLSLGMGLPFSGGEDCTRLEESGQVIQLTFGVGLRTFRVVCHPEAGEWQVCPVCTNFQ